MRRWGTVSIALGCGLSVVLSSAVTARAQELPDPADILLAGLRQVCDLQWIEGACEATGYADPQYRSAEEPNLDQPYALRVGAVHEHSGYSDGDPDARPSDYFTAARSGHNVADAGGDTGVVIDYLLSSEHSENEKLPVTTAEACIDPAALPDQLAALDLLGLGPLACQNVDQADHYRKWAETLAMAVEATEVDLAGEYVGFTGMRGFEWTNDYFNHLGVYFSRNVVNAKIDGSYVTMEAFWNWLREPSTRGGGDDALVVFNHPGSLPALSPFDGNLPHNQILQDTLGGANWNDLEHIPDVDDRVVGIEVNGNDDLAWYIRALDQGWHLGPVAAEDEHQREWSTSADGKTVMLTRGRSPRDYYAALRAHRTMAVAGDVVTGEPGTFAGYPKVLFWADGESIQDPAATVLGGIVEGSDAHSLELDASELPAGSQAVLVSSTEASPRPLGVADADGRLRVSVPATAPTTGEAWWFVTICGPSITAPCGTPGGHSLVTAPIWIRAVASSAPVVLDDISATGPTGVIPATGASIPWVGASLAFAGGLALLALRRGAAAGPGRI